MDNKDFNPYVRFAAKIKEHRPYPERICAYDYRLFFVSKGGFTVEFADHSLVLSAGDAITIPPGIPYRLLFSSESREASSKEKVRETLLYYVINFDFDSISYGKEAHVPQPVHLYDEADIFSSSCLEPFRQIRLFHHAHFLALTIDELYIEELKNAAESAHLTSALMKYILGRLLSISEKLPEADSRAALIHDVKAYVRQNAGSVLTNTAIAKHFDYHPYYLNSLFTKYTGQTLHSYISEVKFQKAKDLLISTNQTIHEIAEACGFQGASYFSEAFLKHQGITPTQFRLRSK